MKQTLTTIAITILTTACVKEYPFKQGDVDKNTIVIEGYVTNEYKRHTIQISKLTSYEDTVRNMLKGAFVAVSSDDSTYFYEETSPGIYESKHKYVGITGNKFFLHIELGDTAILSAQSTMLPVTPPDKLSFSKRDNDKLAINHVAESFVTENPAKYVLQLNWQENDKPQVANLYYYSLTTINISQLFAPKIQETVFPKGTQIIERKYSIDKDYETYLRSLLAETLWSGGYFDEAHGNLHTNINSNRNDINTAGYFSANTVYIDTVYAE